MSNLELTYFDLSKKEDSPRPLSLSLSVSLSVDMYLALFYLDRVCVSLWCVC